MSNWLIKSSKQYSLFTGGPKGITSFNLPSGSNVDGLMYGKGIYLTPDKELAKGYAGSNGVVYEVTANLDNPLTPNSKDWFQFIQKGNADMKYNFLKNKGYDGIVDTSGKYKQVMVVDPNQITIVGTL